MRPLQQAYLSVGRGGRAVWRRLRWILLTLAIVEGAYVVAGNAAIWLWIRAKFEATKNTRVNYGFAWTVVPCVIHVRDFNISNEDTTLQWSLGVRRAVFTLDVLALFHRKFHASRLRGEGVDFRLRLKMTAEQADDPRATQLPPIPGFADPPMRAYTAPPPPLSDEDYKLWTVQLDDVEAGVEQVWVTAARAVGAARVRGTFYLKPLRALAFGPLDVHMRGVDVSFAEQPLVHDVHGVAQVTCALYDPRRDAATLARSFSGEIAVEAQVPNLDALGRIAAQGALPKIGDGSGRLSLAGKLDNGVVRGGSWLNYETDHVSVEADAIRVDASTLVEARAVGTQLAGPRAEIDVTVRSATLTRPKGPPVAPIVTRGVALLRDMSADLLAIRLPSADISATARAPDLRWFAGAEAEASKGVRVVRGSGVGSAHVFVDQEGVARGAVTAALRRAELGFGDAAVRGDAEGHGRFDQARIADGSVHARDVQVDARGVDVLRDGVWRGGGEGHVTVDEGRYVAGALRDVSARFTAKLEDAGFLATKDRMGILGGAATASGSVAFERQTDVTADVEASLEKTMVRVPDTRFSGSIRGKARLVHGDPAKGVGQIVGGSFVTDHLVVTRELDAAARSTAAWARVALKQLDVDDLAPLGFRADVDARIADLGAIIGPSAPFVGAARLVGHVGRAHGREPIAGNLHAELHGGTVAVRGEKIAFDARADTVLEGAALGPFAVRLRDGHMIVTGAAASKSASPERPRGVYTMKVDVPIATVTVPSKTSSSRGPEFFVRARARAADGSVPLEALAKGGAIPAWVPTFFRLVDLDASGVAERNAGVLAFRFDVAGADGRARGAVVNRGHGFDGDLLVWTGPFSLGVDFRAGKTHVHPFAGGAWLTRHLATVATP